MVCNARTMPCFEVWLKLASQLESYMYWLPPLTDAHQTIIPPRPREDTEEAREVYTEEESEPWKFRIRVAYFFTLKGIYNSEMLHI